VRPDPITAAFVAAISVETLVTPPHITSRLCQLGGPVNERG